MTNTAGTTRAIVVGSGIAGLTVALHAARAGVHVTLVTKDVLEHANTRYAQGGIAGVMFADDRAADHARDTLAAAAGLGDPAAVEVLVAEGPERIRELIALGVAFDRDASGAFVKGLEAAHSYPRVLHAGGDATGTAIETALVAAVRVAGVAILEHAFLVDLVREDDGAVTGVDLLTQDGRRMLRADAVVIATGGAGQLYAHTTNPSVATGDGIAAAMRAGAEVTDLEFVQFHPTVLAAGEPFLISEAVRGEGATLIDDDGRRFLFDAHPDGELAPRDVVARAIALRMGEQGGRPVHLDATRLGSTRSGPAGRASTASFLARRFPTIDAAVRDRGLDWAREPIPVTPAAHYLMGGIVTDLDGRTSLPGLYAVGEAARTGVHGANRLASNSLLEGAVFGARAAAALAASRPARPAPLTRPTDPAPLAEDATSRPTTSHRLPGERVRPPFTRAGLQRVMWEGAGVVRDERGMLRAQSLVDGWLAQRASISSSSGSGSGTAAPASQADFEDDNLLQLAAATIRAALARRHSIGAHYRSDDPGHASLRTARREPAASVTPADPALVGSAGC
ncbi:L-aspartate oxidase [Microbacterium sp. BR1]|uniref:L-aspartate oxidase n=1 Tax=Microbacterium sp. BR1 TaxID=1070896 RepID=UPI000C2C50E8|nr:L-aspartate oxidase [Microbacterium sp. BR1]